MTNPYQPPELPLESGYPKRDKLKPHDGTLLLIFGILGVTMCMFFGVASWIMGRKSLREIDEGRMDPKGRGMVYAGWILGIISCVLGAISIVAGVAMFSIG